MRFNTNRGQRLAFDNVAGVYEARPDVPLGIFDWCADQAELAPSQTVVEVGAGTGQLTGRLLASRAKVIAIEPGPEFCSLLRQRYLGAELEVVNSFFEDFRSTQPVAAIWSANAFHWTDPDRGVTQAHHTLRRGGSMVLIWTFLVVEDPEVAALIAMGRLGGRHVNFGGTDPAEFIRNFEESATDGRDQLTRDGRFGLVGWEHQIEAVNYPSRRYPDLVMTFANTAAMDADERKLLHDTVNTDIKELHLRDLTFQHHAYAVVARAANSR